MRILRDYPLFYYKQSITTNGRIILLDEPLEKETREEWKTLQTKDGQEWLFLEDHQLATDLEEFLAEIIKQDCQTLFVFPGNGSNYPRRLSEICQESVGTDVFAKRFWQPGTDPVVTTGLILPDIFLVTNIKTIVVVDDVISSGLTMQKLHEKNAWRFTQASWIGVSWISQIPQMKSRSGVNGYKQITTACVVGKPNGGRVPINSLSTFRRNPEIAKNYAWRHCQNPETFLRLITTAR